MIPAPPLRRLAVRSLENAALATRGAARAAFPAAPRRFRPRVSVAEVGAWQTAETLEDRTLLTTYTVDSLGDDAAADAAGLTLREAVDLANANAGADTIAFAAGLSGGTIELARGQFVLSDEVTIAGLGADALTIDANGASRHFLVLDTATATLAGLTLTGGNRNRADGRGGSVLNAGVLTIAASTLSGNAARDGGAVFNYSSLTVTGSTLSGNAGFSDGGAMNNYGSLTVTGSTLSGNAARSGGAIHNSGPLTVTGSTLSGNAARRDGGAIYSYDGAATLRNVALVGNRANSDGISDGAGGGVWTYNNDSDRTTLHNTLVAGNVRGTAGAETADDLGGLGGQNVDAASSHNLIGDAATSGGLTDGTNGNLVGYAAADVLDTTLADNGGPTLTHALLAGSAAFNAGTNAQTGGATTDQRGPGFDRISGGTVDVGAFEVRVVSREASLSVSAAAGAEADGTVVTVTVTADGPVAGDQTVDLAVTGDGITAGDFTLSAATVTILDGQTSGSVSFTVADDALLEGPETAALTISNPSAGLTLGPAVTRTAPSGSRTTTSPRPSPWTRWRTRATATSPPAT